MTKERRPGREGLRARMVAAAEARIRDGGLAALRARDVTADVGTALGGLYNLFADLDDLILHVNSRTLTRLLRLAEERTATAQGPHGALKALAEAYLDFSRENPELWRAVFDHRMAPDKQIPDWYRNEQATLIRIIVAPLKRLEPELDEDALLVRARTFFAAVHGIVSISTENRFVGVPEADLGRELARFIDIIVTGSEALRAAARGGSERSA